MGMGDTRQGEPRQSGVAGWGRGDRDGADTASLVCHAYPVHDGVAHARVLEPVRAHVVLRRTTSASAATPTSVSVSSARSSGAIAPPVGLWTNIIAVGKPAADRTPASLPAPAGRHATSHPLPATPSALPPPPGT